MTEAETGRGGQPGGDPTHNNSRRGPRRATEPERSEAYLTFAERRVLRARRRWANARAEIERNRRGEYTVPTWVLAATLFAIIAGIAALMIFA